MPNFSQTIIIGHAGSDPEVRYAGETAVANFSVATSEKWKDKSTGDLKEETEWHRVTVWGVTAEKYVGPYLKKGDPVMIRGKMKTRKWQDKEGSDRYSTELIADRFDGVQLLGWGGQKGGNRQQSGKSRGRGPSNDSGQGGAPRQDFDDDLPF